MEHIVWFAKTDAPDQSAAVRELWRGRSGICRVWRMARMESRFCRRNRNGRSALRIRAARLPARYRRALSALISNPSLGG